jgi:hypothetical protein
MSSLSSIESTLTWAQRSWKWINLGSNVFWKRPVITLAGFDLKCTWKLHSPLSENSCSPKILLFKTLREHHQF